VIPADQVLAPHWELGLDTSLCSTLEDYQPYKEMVRNSLAGSPAAKAGMVLDEANVPIDGSFPLVVLKNTRVTGEGTDDLDIKDVRHFVFEKPGDTIDYKPLDTLSIVPKNFKEDVMALMKSQGWLDMGSCSVKFVPTGDCDPITYPEKPIPNLPKFPNVTIFKILTHYVDFRSIPSRSFFRKISQFASNADEKNRLLEYSDMNMLDEYYDFVYKPDRSMADVLQEFASVKIPWQRIVDVFPLMHARDFSIASGGKLKTNRAGTRTRFELIVDIVSYRTSRRNTNNQWIWKDGHCSQYLASRLPGAIIYAKLKRSKYGIKPIEVKESLVMLSCGTGLAPIRSLLYENEMLSRTVEGGRSKIELTNNPQFPLQRTVPFVYMVQGHKNRNHDYLFADEWAREINPAYPFFWDVAFSRRDDGKFNQYVQDLIKTHSNNKIYVALKMKKGIMYICGKAGNFVDEIEKAVVEDFMKGGMTEDEAKEWIKEMKNAKKWRTEVWG
jgi:sulfite reductase alpha subunit-like flavoprotein